MTCALKAPPPHGGGQGGGSCVSVPDNLRSLPPPRSSPKLGEEEYDALRQLRLTSPRVGIHHSSPRGVVTYSGQRKSSGTRKSLGSRGAIQSLPPMPPPVRCFHSPCALRSSSALDIRSVMVAPTVLAAVRIMGSMQGLSPPSAFIAQAG